MPEASKAKMDEAGPLMRFQPMVEVETTWPFAFVERIPLVMDGRKNEVAAERLVVEAEATVSNEPLNVSAVPEVIVEPLKKLTPFVT